MHGQLFGRIEAPRDPNSRSANSKRRASLCTKVGAELTIDAPEAQWPAAARVWVDGDGATAQPGGLTLSGQAGAWVSGLTCAQELSPNVGDQRAAAPTSEAMTRGVSLSPLPDPC